jgi:hypothetical protein
VRVETYQSGPRAGERKPVKLPENAIPLGVWTRESDGALMLDYVVPVEPRKPRR